MPTVIFFIGSLAGFAATLGFNRIKIIFIDVARDVTAVETGSIEVSQVRAQFGN